MQCSFTFRCQWSDCPARYDSYGDLESHLLSEHLTVETVQCQWSNCDHSMTLSDNPLFYLKEHVLQHVQFDASCRNTRSFLVQCDLAGLEHVCTYLPSETVHENAIFQGCVLTSDFSDQIAADNAVFGCIKCLRGFRDETSLLEHFLKSANGVVPKKPVSDDEFYCHWFGCSQSFSSYGRLHAHVIANHNKKNFVPFCFWRHCENKWPLWSGTEEMERHLLLHVFVETCLRRTKRTLLKRKDKHILVCRGIEFQKTSSLYRVASLLLWQSNVLNNGFVCRWRDCGFRVNSPNLFAEHVTAHAGLDFVLCNSRRCQWDMTSTSTDSFRPCDVVVMGLMNRRKHLYRHTGLPWFICETCMVCFMEMPTLVEHFKWSIPGRFAAVGETPDTEAGESPDSILLKCDHCGKRFVTRHGLSGHLRGCRMELLKKTLTMPRRKPSSRSSIRVKRVSHSNYLVAEAGLELERIPKRYLCPVEGCLYETVLYSAYRYHFKRYHSTINPDGLWYACHLCSNYRARKPACMAVHFRVTHGLAPPPGRKRFAYAEDPVDGVYRLVGKPPAPKPNHLRPILPAPEPNLANPRPI